MRGGEVDEMRRARWVGGGEGRAKGGDRGGHCV